MVLKLLICNFEKFCHSSSLKSSNHFLQGVIIVKVTTIDKIPIITRYESEKSFKDPHDEEMHKFPFLEDESSVTLSVVVPAYNEEARCKYN